MKNTILLQMKQDGLKLERSGYWTFIENPRKKARIFLIFIWHQLNKKIEFSQLCRLKLMMYGGEKLAK